MHRPVVSTFESSVNSELVSSWNLTFWHWSFTFKF